MSANAAQQFHHNLVHFFRTPVSYGAGTVSMGWLPAGAIVLDAGMVVTTAFNAGTTNTFDMGFRNAQDGTSDDPDSFATSVASGTTGRKAADEIDASAALVLDTPVEVTVTVKETGTAASAGEGVAYLTYIVDNS